MADFVARNWPRWVGVAICQTLGSAFGISWWQTMLVTLPAFIVGNIEGERDAVHIDGPELDGAK